MTLTMKRLTVAILATMANSAYAEEQKHRFDIPTQPLASALQMLAAQSGAQMLYAEQTAAGKQSHRLSGNYTTDEAARKLLAGSNLIYRVAADGTVTVKPAQETDITTLESMTVTGKAGYDANDPYNKDYTVTNSSTATKTGTPIMETPVSVQIVPRAVLDDQKAARIADALENVSGVRLQTSLGTGSNFIIRGFNNPNIFRNGLRANNDFRFEYDTANLQSIEVLKGPAQLYGRTEPGGLVSLTTKKPLDIPYYSLEQRFGSYDLYRTEWDATGPVTADKSLLYRFTGSYQNNNSFRDFVSNDRMLFAPSVTWRPTESTDATLELQVNNQDFISDVGIPVIGNRPAPIPISRSLGDPNTPTSNVNQVFLGSLLNHRFNEDWAIHSRFLASFDHGDDTFINPTPAFDPAAALDQTTGIMQRNVFGQAHDGESYATNLDLTGRFNLGFSKHEVLLGFDFYRSFQNYGTNGFFNIPDPALAINIFNPSPSYGVPQTVFNTALMQNEGSIAFRSTSYDQWEGIYFQDQITLWDKLHIMGGGRYDWTETARAIGGSFSETEARVGSVARNDDGFSPRVGILYQPIHELSVYGNWTTSFGANNGVSATGGTFDPQIGEQFEAGIKTSLFDERFLATLAYYHLTKDNLLTPDLSTADITDSIAIGQQRSQGIELDMTGQITDALSLIGSYAYTDARVTKDDSGLLGKQLSNVPDHAGSLWLKYDFSGHKTLNGFSVGLGTVAAGQREGDIDNTFQLPGYVRVDAFAAYKWNIKQTRVTAQFNIRNLLDKQYYASTDPNSNVSPALGVAPGAPLMAIDSIRVEF